MCCDEVRAVRDFDKVLDPSSVLGLLIATIFGGVVELLVGSAEVSMEV